MRAKELLSGKIACRHHVQWQFATRCGPDVGDFDGLKSAFLRPLLEVVKCLLLFLGTALNRFSQRFDNSLAPAHDVRRRQQSHLLQQINGAY